MKRSVSRFTASHLPIIEAGSSLSSRSCALSLQSRKGAAGKARALRIPPHRLNKPRQCCARGDREEKAPPSIARMSSNPSAAVEKYAVTLRTSSKLTISIGSARRKKCRGILHGHRQGAFHPEGRRQRSEAALAARQAGPRSQTAPSGQRRQIHSRRRL